MFTGIVTALMVNRLKRRMEIDDMDCRGALASYLACVGQGICDSFVGAGDLRQCYDAYDAFQANCYGY